MTDPRCCGTGSCLINAEGRCWCGQQWNGDRMCFPEPPAAASDGPRSTDTQSADGAEAGGGGSESGDGGGD